MSQFSQAIDELISQVKNATDHSIRIVQRLAYAPDVSCLDWLDAQPHFPKFYWQSRDAKEEVVALGQIRSFLDPTSAYAILGKEQRIWGGKAFDAYSANEGNDRISSYFFLPQIELVRLDDTWSLCVNVADDKEAIISALSDLCSDVEPLMPVVAQAHVMEHIPSQNVWDQQVEDALTRIKGKQLKKVVLARKSLVNLDDYISGAQLLKASCGQNKHSFHFLFALDNQQAFIGSTPERLYRQDGQKLETEALAGTIGRGESALRDLELANWLMQDEKNLIENQYVLDDLIERLTPHTHHIESQSNVHLIPLREVQHLKRKVHASLKDGINGAQLLSALQPTAAVAGLPREKAVEYIQQNELFSRGWYSGSMGYISHQKAEFCVAIRSATVEGNEVQLYAGAGIVKGSQADVEWFELDKKVATLLGLFQSRDHY